MVDAESVCMCRDGITDGGFSSASLPSLQEMHNAVQRLQDEQTEMLQEVTGSGWLTIGGGGC